jgi:DNA segregation ATPase FtsK/SpoIIIE, S-DNA-T family
MSLIVELGWWARSVWRLVRRAPGPLCLAAAASWWGGGIAVIGWATVIGVIAIGRFWVLLRPASYSRFVGPFRGLAWRWRVRGNWLGICAACRLDRPEPPRILRNRVAWPHARLVIRPAFGQTASDFDDASEAIRAATGASRLRIEPAGSRDLLLIFTVGDELRVPFAARPCCTVSTTRVPMGRTENGGRWELPLGPHTLVAGSSGSGKGSVFWSLAFGLAPAVRTGVVQLHGIDLKGGMEILMGEQLFTTTATDAAHAVVSLERLVREMQLRSRLYAGRVRAHVPSAEMPLHVVMIDELAALTAYCSERDLQRRAETAINLLCSQGRAPGFMVFACLQDPRKEVIPARGLFTQMVGLRLKDLAETAMVLGEVAVESGAHCHRITRDVPGTGFVLPEDGTHPLRVRAGFASDDAIREVASEYAAPDRIELTVPVSDDELPTRVRRKATT